MSLAVLSTATRGVRTVERPEPSSEAAGLAPAALGARQLQSPMLEALGTPAARLRTPSFESNLPGSPSVNGAATLTRLQAFPAALPSPSADVWKKPPPAAARAGAASGVPGAPDTVPRRDDKPVDPTKTADDYLNANNGLLKRLGNQEGMKDKLKARYGDWTDANRSAEDRAQSAYNAARHIGIIKHKLNREGGDRGDVVNSGRMHGCTKSGDIRDGTEMADLKNSLKEDPPKEQRGDPAAWANQDRNTDQVLSNPNLKHTKDKHVRLNGTTRSSHTVNLEKAGKIISFVNPVLGQVLKGMGESDKERPTDFGKMLVGGAKGYVNHLENVGEGALNAVKKGRITPAGLALSIAKETTKDAIADIAKDVKNKSF